MRSEALEKYLLSEPDFSIATHEGNPMLRVVSVGGCLHVVSLADGRDTPARNFVGFALAEHFVFCLRGRNG